MTPGTMAMLVGAFAVPALLLWSGHRLRKRTRRWRLAFVGALVGHLLAAPVAMVAAMVPPEEWGAADAGRGFLGFWLLVAAPALGALLGAALGGRRRGPPAA